MWIWLRWPEELEADLLVYYNLDIGLWHRLTVNPDTGAPYLSSRRLLALADRLPDKSEVKTAARGGRWPIETQMLANIFNEQVDMRASYHAAHSTDEVDVRFDPSDYYLLDPVVRKARAELEAVEAEIAEQTVPELSDAGWM